MDAKYYLTAFLVCCLVFATLRFSQCEDRETFTSIEKVPLQGSKSDYIREMQNLSGLVGLYVGDVYKYLRAKYMPENNPPGVTYIPNKSIALVSKDPALPFIRELVVGYIEAWKASSRTRYEPSVLESMKPEYDLDYIFVPTKNQNWVTGDEPNIIKLIYVEKGARREYLI